MIMNIKISATITIIVMLLNSCGYKKTELPVTGIVQRIAPQFADDIVFEQIESHSGKDVFEFQSMADGKILIRGNNSISMAMGFNHFLKYYCLTSVSWFVDQPVQLPDELPVVTEKIRKEARVDRRFFLNYCTYGYTMPWWQWRDWERLIDWMALNGINMPLATTGQESIWYKVWQDFGLSDEEIREYFTGPAHLPWHRMSNIDKLDGPLPLSYMDHQFDLQKKILERERKLGMTPVLPAFNGHVPDKLKRIFPEAKISRLGNPAGMDNPYSCYMMDPIDSLFKKIQKAFIEEQTRQFGTDHIYGIDPLNEIEPPSWEPEYLSGLTKTLYESMIEADPKAEWLQMGWLFYFSREHWTDDRIKAMLTAVPQGKMILLDYFCDNTEVWKMTESFYDQPYIWCYLGNFGGNTLLAGNMKEAEKRLTNALQNGGENLNGIGSTPEGLDVNPLVYEFIFEQAWESDNTDLSIWFNHWADRRCGSDDENVREAWQILLDNIYSSVPTLAQVPLMGLRPTLTGHGNWTEWPPLVYPNATLFHAWELMLDADHQSRDAYQYDVVNIGRQVLGNHFLKLRDQFTSCYNSKNLSYLKTTGAEMNELLQDLDMLLSTRHSFLLGHWIEDARMFASDSSEADYYERNSRLVITSMAGIVHPLNDYANRNWAGLIESFYAKRWEMFIGDVINAIEKNENFDETKYLEKVTKFERKWENSKEKFNARPVGNSISTAKQLIKKYRTRIVN